MDEPSSQADPFLVALEHIEARLSALEQKAGLPATVPHPVGNGLAIAILDAPSYPNAAVSPNRPVLAAAGFAIGFFAALVIFLVRRSKAAMPGLPSWSAE